MTKDAGEDEAISKGYMTQSYSPSTPHITPEETVDKWIKDYENYVGTIAERNVMADGQIVHDWGIPVRKIMK